MSVWTKVSEQLPPMGEEVLILFKYEDDPVEYENLFYGVAARYTTDPSRPSEECWDWTQFAEYQWRLEVVYWARLYDMPRIEQTKEDG